MRTWMLVFALAVVVACAEPEAVLDLAPLVTQSEAPEVGLDLESGGLWITPGALSGYAVDAEQAPATLPVVVSSSLSGELWRGNPDGDGQWSWTGDLPTGEHIILVTAEDREGNQVASQTPIVVRTNAAPDCRIVEPIYGTTVRARTDLVFRATASDPDGDPLTAFWRSDLDGPLVEGLVFTRRLVNRGEHRISLEVLDGFGVPCVDEVRVTVE